MLEKPLIVKDKLKEWRVLSYDESDWCRVFGEGKLRFRKGHKKFRGDPYWEQDCGEVNITIKDFFDRSKSKDENDFWLYFDYRHMKEVLPEGSEVFKEIKWSELGLKNLKSEDSTIWIGNKGAHTPCHMDTYGCNLVVQVVGRKLWILIPPDGSDSLFPVRVPYEESSIYSSYNFYTPTLNLLRLRSCYKVILNPGEFLFIPKHWWHYVENLELAISINIWIPQESDHEDRLKEALVRNYVSNICQGLPEAEAKKLLNPNEYELLAYPFEEESIKVFLDRYEKFRKENRSENFEEFEHFLSKNAIEVSPFLTDELKKFIEDKCNHHGYDIKMKSKNCKRNFSIQKTLINSYCHPSVVSLVKEKLTGGLSKTVDIL